MSRVKKGLTLRLSMGGQKLKKFISNHLMRHQFYTWQSYAAQRLLYGASQSSVMDKPARSDVLFPHAGSQHSKYTISCNSPMVESNAPGNIARGFIGRQTELAELEANVAGAVAGRGRLVMLAGEPGIGKTRTAEELGVLAGHQGAQVFWGRCYEEQGVPPYWPWAW